MYSYPMMETNDGGSGLLTVLLGLVFLVVVIAVVHRLLKNSEMHSAHQLKPIDIAKVRYAKGEITKEEFEQVKKDLAV